MFLTTVQAHYGIAGEVVEGGQLLAFYNPYAINTAPLINITNPIAGNPYNAGSNISFDAMATDADGVISKVEFFNNGNNPACKGLFVPRQYILPVRERVPPVLLRFWRDGALQLSHQDALEEYTPYFHIYHCCPKVQVVQVSDW